MINHSSKLDPLELDSFTNQCIISSIPDFMNKSQDEINDLKKNVKTSDMILRLEEQAKKNTRKTSIIEENLSNKMKNIHKNAKDDPCFNWCSNDISKYDNSIFAKYTKDSLEQFEKYEPSNNLLANIQYPDSISDTYFDSMEEKRSSTLKIELHKKRSNKEDVELDKKHIPSPMELINKYIDDYATHIKHVDDVVCQVCNNGDCEDDNTIVFCSECNTAVHQNCYGIPEIPSDDWICDVCKTFGLNQRKLLKCFLCSIRGGAMKQTTTRAPDSSVTKNISGPIMTKSTHETQGLLYDFKQDFTSEELANEPHPEYLWIHLSCGFWLSELALWSKDITYPISGIDTLDPRRSKLTCSICKQRGVGYCVQCSKGKCQAAFHTECARLAGVYMQFDSSNEEPGSNIIFCDKHKPSRLKKDMDRDAKRSLDDIINFCRMIDKCRAVIEKCDEDTNKLRKHTSTSKLFNKLEKKKLIDRVRFICRKYGKLTINLSKQIDKEGKEKYKMNSVPYTLCYMDTINKQFFPWNEVKINSKFSPLSCYNKYVSIVPTEDSFKMKVLQMDKAQIETEKQKIIEELKKIENDKLKYCYCGKTAAESIGPMLGI